jgi:ElaB/YqjD/DUF883 family membrane-anchored ribosome-binding protein
MSAQGTAQKGKSEELAASKAAAMEAYEKLLEAQQHFQQAAHAAGMDLKDEALEQVQKGREKAEELSNQVGDYVRDKPTASLGFAFLAGYVLANILSRR